MIDHRSHAVRIRNAYSGPAIAPLRHSEPEATIEDAYKIQALNTLYWLESGRLMVGAKIGLTSKAVQKQLGVDQPDFGILFADMQIADGGIIPSGRLLQPRVEAEIAFCMGVDLGDPDGDLAKVAGAVAYAVPAIEVVDSRIIDWDIKMVDTIADNASSGLFVLGTQPIEIAGLDLEDCTMTLERNGKPVSQGSSAACLGNPLNALTWLAGARARRGAPLRAGEIVLAGALGPMVPATPGDNFRAEIRGLGCVGVSFAP